MGEDVIISRDGNLVTGDLEITNGSFVERGLNIRGKSLIDSAELTAKAFSQSSMNEYGGYLVAIALLLFAFSTALPGVITEIDPPHISLVKKESFGTGISMFYVLF